ncbi:hypothetical protein EJK15_69910 [Nonomuraea basaltis]|nr:hypothetical protein EJK15_69910 [Nonomuraea basaltis]
MEVDTDIPFSVGSLSIYARDVKGLQWQDEHEAVTIALSHAFGDTAGEFPEHCLLSHLVGLDLRRFLLHGLPTCHGDAQYDARDVSAHLLSSAIALEVPHPLTQSDDQPRGIRA